MKGTINYNFFDDLALSDQRLKREIESKGKSEFFEANQIIYKQDAPADSVYVIVSGVVEAMTSSPDGSKTRPLAFMRRGEFFGELGVILGKNRTATVMACEKSEVIKFDRALFCALMEKYPAFSLFISRNMARRFHETVIRDSAQTYGLELSGNLQVFDLLTVFQAITGGAHTGELRLIDNNQDLIGSFFFEQGQVRFARFAHLEGLEAVREGFVQSATEGNFAFQLMQTPQLPFDPQWQINLNSTDLLMQGVGQRDTYQGFPIQWKKMEGRLSFLVKKLTWPDEETWPVAQALWDLSAKHPQPLKTLWRRMNFSSVTFLQALQICIDTRQAEVVAENVFKTTSILSIPARPETKKSS